MIRIRFFGPGELNQKGFSGEQYVREDVEPVLVLVPHIKNQIAGAVDVHVSHITKDVVEAVP